MRELQLHYVKGGGDRADKGKPMSFSTNAGDLTFRLGALREAVRGGVIHSVSVWDVTDGSRRNVTRSFVDFDTRKATKAELNAGRRFDF